MDDLALARELAARVARCGGRAYFVGGCVRDGLMGIESEDIDIEIHELAAEALEAVLGELGEPLLMGRSFGVFGLKGANLDIALPRTERATGLGHRDFSVSTDPMLGLEEAASRRDFTINAMMRDVLSGEIIDPFGGQRDLALGRIRHVSDRHFAEDPLRVLRAAQFAARFGFSVAPETVSLCRGIGLEHLARERVMEELKKALLKGARPSVFFGTLKSMDQLQTWFPEIARLENVPQNRKHHAEGDVWTHTMMVLDQAAMLRPRAAHPLYFMLSALLHDLGKLVATAMEDGVWHAYGHETAGLPLTEAFLRRLTDEKKCLSMVLNHCRLHMKPGTLAHAGAAVKSTNRLFDSSLCPEDLILLSLADGRGKIPPAGSPEDEQFLFDRLAVYRRTMEQPQVTGDDLQEAGFAPGPDFTGILEYAHKLALAGMDRNTALSNTLGYARALRGGNAAGGDRNPDSEAD
ncbi:MAG: HD domain-containing protein [Clostridia bacterium]|nr:HD domain-containing protein [Clostridia bacterium]